MAEFSEFSHVFLNLPLKILGNSLVCEELINEILGLGVLLFKLTEAQILHIKKKKKKVLVKSNFHNTKVSICL